LSRYSTRLDTGCDIGSAFGFRQQPFQTSRYIPRGPRLIRVYDITFTARAEPYKKRRKSDRYNDLSMLTQDVREPILFFGGKDYFQGKVSRITSNNGNLDLP
jgi:hypothetical protein